MRTARPPVPSEDGSKSQMIQQLMKMDASVPVLLRITYWALCYAVAAWLLGFDNLLLQRLDAVTELIEKPSPTPSKPDFSKN